MSLFDYGMTIGEEPTAQSLGLGDLWYYPPQWSRFLGDEVETLVDEGWFVTILWAGEDMCNEEFMIWGTEHAMCEPTGFLGGPEIYERPVEVE